MDEITSPNISRQDGVTVISLGPEYESLDEGLLDSVREPLLQAAEAADPPLVVLDLSHTQFFGSGFIEILFQIWNGLNSREGGVFAICGLTPYCTEVIQVTHLDRLWRFFDSRDEAVSAVSQS